MSAIFGKTSAQRIFIQPAVVYHHLQHRTGLLSLSHCSVLSIFSSALATHVTDKVVHQADVRSIVDRHHRSSLLVLASAFNKAFHCCFMLYAGYPIRLMRPRRAAAISVITEEQRHNDGLHTALSTRCQPRMQGMLSQPADKSELFIIISNTSQQARYAARTGTSC